MSAFKCWEPLWSTCNTKAMGKDEIVMISHITTLVGLTHEDIETVLDVRGRKTLRIKLFKGWECNIPLYEYLFFGPIIFSGKQIFLAERAKNEEGKKNVTCMLDVEQLIDLIKKKVKIALSARAKLDKLG